MGDELQDNSDTSNWNYDGESVRGELCERRDELAGVRKDGGDVMKKKICHWTIRNGSGMARVAESIAAAECVLGFDSIVSNPQDAATYEQSLDADIHVSHTHFPDGLRKRVTKPLKICYVNHGTPEHIFQSALEDGTRNSYGHADGWMLTMNWLRTADAVVTFWPRHQAIWQSMCDKGRTVHCVPLGVDKEFWKPVTTRGKFVGEPSIFTAENCHWIKAPFDLFLAWPWVVPHLKGEGKLHCAYLPRDQHRWYFSLVNRNGCSYSSHISPIAFDHETLRNAFCSTDFFIGLVQKGDFNRLSLEAAASGAKTISYTGNPYADFWIPEGDQRVIAEHLIAILNGKVAPRADKAVVPSIVETAQAMIKIYESLL